MSSRKIKRSPWVWWHVGATLIWGCVGGSTQTSPPENKTKLSKQGFEHQTAACSEWHYGACSDFSIRPKPMFWQDSSAGLSFWMPSVFSLIQHSFEKRSPALWSLFVLPKTKWEASWGGVGWSAFTEQSRIWSGFLQFRDDEKETSQLINGSSSHPKLKLTLNNQSTD